MSQLSASHSKLVVDDLRVEFTNAGKTTLAVQGVSFNLGREKLAIVGESGSGKSTVGRALLRLHPATARITAKTLRFDDIDLLSASEKQMQGVRGRRMSMIMQDPKYSLNPVVKVGEQIAEAYLAHHKVSHQEAKERALDMLAKVHIRDPQRVYQLYPHEVSGGMGQRIMIAMMVITDPDVIIADEPTSALDVSVRRQVLNVLEELVSER
ncbi:MAG: ABC transporter ATP-binding protein, partial [Pseudomonas caspiana]